MDVENELRNILIDMYYVKLNNQGRNENELDFLFGEKDDISLVHDNIDEILSHDIVDEYYNYIFNYFNYDITQLQNTNCKFLSFNEQCTTFSIANFLIAYFIKNYILFHYNDPLYKEELTVISNTKFNKLRFFYYDNEMAAKKFIRCLFVSLANPEVLRKNEELMKSKNEEYLIKEVDSHCKYITLSLNDLLRNVFLEYFNSFINQGYPLKDAVLASTIWIFSEEDVNNTFKKMNLSKKEIFKYKHYFRKLMIADVAEDALNTPRIYSETNIDSEFSAISFSYFAILNNAELEALDKETLLSFVYHYINLLHDSVKFIANRTSTIENKRLFLIKKYNPSFMLDEF